MGGVKAPAKKFHLKTSPIDLPDRVVEKEIIKEVRCPKQDAELAVIKQRLANEGQKTLELNMAVRKLEAEKSGLRSKLRQLGALSAKASQEPKIIEKIKHDKKLAVVCAVAGLLAGLGIGALL